MQNEKKTVALYCRVGREDTEAAHMQAKMLREYAKKLGFTVYDEYVDSGLSPDRPAFRQMNEDIRVGRVQSVLVKDAARLYRVIPLLYDWLEDMRRRGVAAHTPYGEIESQRRALREAVWVGHGKKRDG